jgi:hypothetical protein
LAAALAGLLALSGCGVGAEDEAHVLAGPDLVTPLPTPTPPVSGTGPHIEKLCLIKDARVVRVERRVLVEPTPASLIDHLFAGPTKPESDQGLTSALAGTTKFQSVTVAGMTAVVAMAPSTEDSTAELEIPMAAQIVCTLTGLPNVTQVQFTRDGKPLMVPRADSALSGDPLTLADYATMIEPTPQN